MTSALPFSSMTELHAARQVPLNAKMTVEEQESLKHCGEGSFAISLRADVVRAAVKVFCRARATHLAMPRPSARRIVSAAVEAKFPALGPRGLVV